MRGSHSNVASWQIEELAFVEARGRVCRMQSNVRKFSTTINARKCNNKGSKLPFHRRVTQKTPFFLLSAGFEPFLCSEVCICYTLDYILSLCGRRLAVRGGVFLLDFLSSENENLLLLRLVVWRSMLFFIF